MGILFFIMTLTDGNKRKPELNTSYIMHLKGYVAGIIIFIIGLMMFLKN